jgi:error-prone DNA polymerase
VVFVTLEDETGIANLVVWPRVFERHRAVTRLSSTLLVTGKVERQGIVVHIHASAIESLDERNPELHTRSRDFH